MEDLILGFFGGVFGGCFFYILQGGYRRNPLKKNRLHKI